MNRVERKTKFITYVRNNQQIIAGFMAIIALMISFPMIIGKERAGVIDYGEYARTLYEMGLTYTKEVQNEVDLRYVKVIEEFEVEHIQILRLLQLQPSQSLIYPVSFVALLCKLMKVPFSTQYLSVLYTLITILCIYSITKSAYYYLKEKAAAVGIISSFILLCGNYTIYFNSLYRNGIYFVSFLSYFTILLHIGVRKGKVKISKLILLIFTSLLLLNSINTTILYLPIILVGNIWAIVCCRPKKEKRIGYYLMFFIFLLFIIRCNILFTFQNETLFSNTQLYHSFFTGALNESDDKEELLQELKLDASLEVDIGKNAYLPTEDYIISPNSNEAEKLIFNKLSFNKLLKLYFKYPNLYKNTLKKTANQLERIDNRRFLAINRKTNEGTEWVERFIWWQWIRTLIVPKSLLGYAIFFLTILIMLVFLFFHAKKKKVEVITPIFLIGILIWTAVLLQFLIMFAWIGFAEKDYLNYFIILPFDVLIIYSFCLALRGGILVYDICKERFTHSNKETEAEMETMSSEVEEELFLPNPIFLMIGECYDKVKKLFVSKVLSSPNKAAALFMVISTVIVFGVLFYPTRIGAYNNGDFGRMMSAMNIQYTKEDWEKVDELSLTKVVERYDWVENYDYKKVLPSHADLSQIWFSLPLKLIDNLVGLKFSTVYVTIMYAILIVVSIFFIMQVLFRRFGVKTIWLSIALLFILLDYVNLGWLNSLFGEGIAFVSLLLVIASALKVADSKRKCARFSILCLLFSELLFIGAKAQYTITVPIFILANLILFWYHQPQKILKRYMYYILFLASSMWLSVSAYHIYQNNNAISSPDTVYQSIFYGLLMLVDDKEKTLTDLGLDTEMAVDTGKHAYLDKSTYFCPPRTKKAEEMLYSKISTSDILFYYVKHPKLLLKSMDITANAAAKDMPDYTLIVGQKTTEKHDKVERFHIWGTIRSYLVFDRFFELLIVVILQWGLSIRYLLKRSNPIRDKMLIGVFLMISIVEICQYPLTFIGNGFADNTKQLYMFRLIYDLTIVVGIFLIVPTMKRILDYLGNGYANHISFRNMIRKIRLDRRVNYDS